MTKTCAICGKPATVSAIAKRTANSPAYVGKYRVRLCNEHSNNGFRDIRKLK
jgi:hypothetical protein